MTGVENATTHGVKVQLRGYEGRLAASTHKAVVLVRRTDPPVEAEEPPAAPELSGSLIGGKPVLTWTVPSGAIGFKLLRASAFDGIYTTIASTYLVMPTYTDNTAVKGTHYWYKVIATTGVGGTGTNSSDSNVVDLLLIPAIPTNVVVTTNGQGGLTISWTGSTGATSYTVKRGTSSGGPYSTVVGNPSGTSINDSGLADSTTYYYVVCATNATGSSADSAQGSGTTLAPAAPNAPVLTGVLQGGVPKLDWTSPSGANGYVLKRSTDGSNFTDVYTV